MTHLKIYAAYAILAVLSLVSVHTLAQPTVALTSATGHPGDEVQLAVQTKGLGQVTAVQLDITLPQTLTYVDASAVLGQGIVSADHQLQVTQSGNQLRIYIYSLQLNVMNNGQGELMTFRLHVGAEPGTYQLIPSTVLSDVNGNSVSASVTSGVVTVLCPKIQLSTKEIDFGRVPIRGTYFETLTASNTGNEPLSLTGAESLSSLNPSLLALSGLPCTIEPGAQKELDISYAPINAGQENAAITITSNAANGSQKVTVKALPYTVNELILKTTNLNSQNSDLISVSVEMENMDPIVAIQCFFDLPDALTYVDGSLQMNEVRSNGHQLSSSIENGKLKIFIHSASNAAIAGDKGELFSFQLLPVGASGNYQLIPSDVILSNASGINVLSDVNTATIHLSSPELEADVELDFGSVPLEEKISSSYRLRNVGEAPLTISRVEFDNAAFSTTSTLPIIIQAGAEKSMEIVFQTEQIGPFQGIMQLYCDDPDLRMLTVNIKGDTYYPNRLSLSGKPVEDNAGQYALTMNLHNSLPIVALQADIHWIPRMTTNTDAVSLSDRAGNHQVALTQIANDTYRLFLYSTNNQIITAGEGPLVTLIYNNVEPDVSYLGTTMTVDNIILSTPNGQNQASSSVTTIIVKKKGDVNGDGFVTVADVTAIVDFLLERQTDNITAENADVNGDGYVSIIDVVETIQLILSE